MGGITGGDYVNSSGIKRGEFESQLNAQGFKGDKLAKAMSVFDRYAETNNAAGEGEGVLNEVEQGLARDEFADMDINSDGTVSKKEFKQQNINGTTYKEYKRFIGAFNELAKDNDVAVTPDTDNSDFQIVTDAGSDNPTVMAYTYGDEQVAEPPQTPKNPVFETTNAAREAVYKYLLNTDSLTEADIQRLDSMEVLKDIKIEEVAEGGVEQVKITYDDKEFILRKVGDNYSIDQALTAEGDEGITLQQAILKSNSTDTKHNYYNKYGKVGNDKSKYDSQNGVITNDSGKKQHVNPVQTFTSMILNNTEDSTLAFRQGLSGQDIIDVMNVNDKTEKKEITLDELIKYINASVEESKKAEAELNAAGSFRGSRTAAKDVDLDLKDLTNLGIVFKKFDADNSGGLNVEELNKLIEAFTKDKTTMTKMAKDAKDLHHAYNKPSEESAASDADQTATPPADPNPDEGGFKPHYGARVSGPDRTRHLAGTNKDKDQDVSYVMDGNRRTLVEKASDGKWRTVENANIAEYEDHGVFGAGRKDFIRINGLSSNVRAEVIGDVKNDTSLVIKVKDANGVTTYRQVTKNKDGTYKLGGYTDKKGNPNQGNTQSVLNALGLQNNERVSKVPQDLAIKKKHGKPVFMIKGREVKPDVARAHVIAYNIKPEKIQHVNRPRRAE